MCSGLINFFVLQSLQCNMVVAASCCGGDSFLQQGEESWSNVIGRLKELNPVYVKES